MIPVDVCNDSRIMMFTSMIDLTPLKYMGEPVTTHGQLRLLYSGSIYRTEQNHPRIHIFFSKYTSFNRFLTPYHTIIERFECFLESSP
jgi:hypothetical protein